MFTWLINHLLIYVLVFFWGYFNLKFFYGGFFSVLFAIILVSAYYDFSHNVSFVTDMFYIIGALDYKIRLREQTSLYLQFAWQVGLSGVKEDIQDRINTIREKFTLNRENIEYDDFSQENSYQDNFNHTHSDFNQDWYDEQLRQEREKARQAKEEAKRAKEEANRTKQQSQQNTDNKRDLDPTKLKDAYEILGVPYGTDKAECKKHFRRLMAMYHPDKLAGFTGYRRKQMEQEAKDIGLAWEAVENKG